jgi:hypothetical protein
MTVLGCPVLRAAPFEGENQHRNIALDEATKFFDVFRDLKHESWVVSQFEFRSRD